MQYTIRFDNGAHFACAENCTVAQAMKQAALRPTMHGCGGGGCGVCRVRVLAGEYFTKPMSREHISVAEQRAGLVLACCLVPRSDLSLTTPLHLSGFETTNARPIARDPKSCLRVV